ncbi:MAG: hypothetical protein RIM23_27275 [Coleofasciculus sp. G3-WIS-01]
MHELYSSSSTPAERFRRLQSQLRDRWSSIELFDQDDRDILVVPSVSVDQRELALIPGFLHYEERLLFSLIRLRNPRTRRSYITAVPLSHPLVPPVQKKLAHPLVPPFLRGTEGGAIGGLGGMERG